MPKGKQFCDYDAFTSSLSINGKVFLHPYRKDERRGDWHEAVGYCARHCAEIVVINSVEENDLFLAFMRSLGMTAPGVWLGAVVNDKVPFPNWYNGAPAIYNNKAAGEYNNAGHTCVSANRGLTPLNLWYNDNCLGDTFYIACQRSDKWVPCE